MRTIITGGTGLIGRALARELLGAGHEVVVLSRAPERVRGLPAGVRAERWDARTAAGWAARVEGVHAIVNLAGENLAAWPWSPQRMRVFRDSRVNAGQAVVAAVEAADQKPKVVIQASAVGYYGPRGDEEVPESDPPGDNFLARLAVDWESSTAPVEAIGVRRAVIRTGLVLSREGGPLRRMLLPFRLGVGGPLGSGRQWWPWIHIADEVGAIRFLIEHDGAQGAFNLAAPHALTNAEFSRLLGRVLGRPALLPAPAPVLGAVLGELSTVLLDGQRAVPRRLLGDGYTFRFSEPEAAIRDWVR